MSRCVVAQEIVPSLGPEPAFIALSVLHLLADLVAQNLVPVDLGACDRQLAAQGLEGGVRHGLVILTDRGLEAGRHGNTRS